MPHSSPSWTTSATANAGVDAAYTKFYPAAVEVVQALASSGGGGACAVGGDGQALAKELISASQNGKLRVLEPRYLRQIQDVANETAGPDCDIDVGTLQLMVLAVRSFESYRLLAGELDAAG